MIYSDKLKKTDFEIYTFSDGKNSDKLKRDTLKYGIKRKILEDASYCDFVGKAIGECEKDYILLTTDNVLLPLQISEITSELIFSLNKEAGGDGWLMAGNSGVEFLSRKKREYRNDKGEWLAIPPASVQPRPAIFLDSNVILVNLKNLKNKKIKIDFEVQDENLLIFYLLAEGYKKDLISYLDSNLYAYNEIKKQESEKANYCVASKFTNYWRRNFINYCIFTLEGEIFIENDLDYLIPPADCGKLDFYDLTEKVVFNRILKRKPKRKLYVIIRTTLKYPDKLKRLLETARIAKLYYGEVIDINLIISGNNFSERKESDRLLDQIKKEYIDIVVKSIYYDGESDNTYDQYPRVAAIKNALSEAEDDSFIWLVDDDDFIFPDSLRYFPFMLDRETVCVCDSMVFEEKWKDGKSFPIESKKLNLMDGSEYFKAVKGINHIPVCNVVYPARVLKKVFENFELRGDYFEDYAIFLLSSRYVSSIEYYPICIAGISYHGKNTVLEKNRTHWNYSYSAFMNEVVNSGFMSDIFYENIIHLKKNLLEKSSSVKKEKKITTQFSKILSEIGSSELIAKANSIRKKKGILKMAYYFIQYLKYGRHHFKDGIERLEKMK